MTKPTTRKTTAASKKVAAKKATPKAAPAKKAVPKAAAANTERTFQATALLAAQAAKDTPKSAVLRTSSGFYTGSKRAGVKAGAEFIGRVASVIAAKSKAKPRAPAA